MHFVRYVDKFSRSLSVEYKQYGVDVQCQVYMNNAVAFLLLAFLKELHSYLITSSLLFHTS